MLSCFLAIQIAFYLGYEVDCINITIQVLVMARLMKESFTEDFGGKTLNRALLGSRNKDQNVWRIRLKVLIMTGLIYLHFLGTMKMFCITFSVFEKLGKILLIYGELNRASYP